MVNPTLKNLFNKNDVSHLFNGILFRQPLLNKTNAEFGGAKMDTETPNSTTLTASDLRQRQKSTGANRVEINGNLVNLEELSDADAQLASQFGYKPVFKREFGYLSTFSFAVSISGLFATVMTTFSFPLVAGGSASAVWCWLISGAGCMCIAVSI